MKLRFENLFMRPAEMSVHEPCRVPSGDFLMFVNYECLALQHFPLHEVAYCTAL